MSGNSSGEKSEKATPSKLRKARQKGNLPRSRDVTMTVATVSAFVILSMSLPFYKQLVQESFISVQTLAARLDDPNALKLFAFHNMFILLKFLATLLPVPVLVIISGMIPGGWNFTPNKILPDLKKLNPISGLKQIFSASKMTDVLKMIAKCIVILLLLYTLIQSHLAELLHLQSQVLPIAIERGFSIYYGVLIYFVLTLILFAVIDIPLSKFLFMKKMKMTKQEVKEEHKQNDGNPQIKGRIRQLQRQISMGQISRSVPQADVVLTNPTHYAVALKYDPDKAKAPYILAKGMDDMALYIRQVAENKGIEVVEFPTLARAVYHSTRVNQQIPMQLYRAIAHVLTYVLQLKSWRSGNGDKPLLNKQISIAKEVLMPDVKS
ncbi:MAG: flagellar biosynthesis protein FlhB [Enterobacteriaceae bacterium]